MACTTRHILHRSSTTPITLVGERCFAATGRLYGLWHDLGVVVRRMRRLRAAPLAHAAQLPLALVGQVPP